MHTGTRSRGRDAEHKCAVAKNTGHSAKPSIDSDTHLGVAAGMREEEEDAGKLVLLGGTCKPAGAAQQGAASAFTANKRECTTTVDAGAAMQNVITADAIEPIGISDKNLVTHLTEIKIECNSKVKLELDLNVLTKTGTNVATRQSPRLKLRRTSKIGCSDTHATQKTSPFTKFQRRRQG